MFARRNFQKVFGFPPRGIPDAGDEHIVSLVLRRLQEELTQKGKEAQIVLDLILKTDDVDKALDQRKVYERILARQRWAEEALCRACELAVRFGIKKPVGSTVYGFLLVEEEAKVR